MILINTNYLYTYVQFWAKPQQHYFLANDHHVTLLTFPRVTFGTVAEASKKDCSEAGQAFRQLLLQAIQYAELEKGGPFGSPRGASMESSSGSAAVNAPSLAFVSKYLIIISF